LGVRQINRYAPSAQQSYFGRFDIDAISVKILRLLNDNQIEGEPGMASEIRSDGLRVLGTRPIRPDGVEKVTGRANFGADRAMPGMLYGKIKRSPHAHARIVRISTESALALPGVRAVVTAADFPEIPPEEAFVGEGPMNFRDLSRNVMARGKALYEGHAVAAVAAVSPAIAAEALELIEVEYEVLPHVIDVEEAMADGAPLLHEDLFTQGIDPKPEKPSNIAKRISFAKGDAAAGFRQADVIIERRYTTKPVHQAYIEPHACVVSTTPDGQAQIWASSQGQFMIRAYCAKLLGIDMANIRVTPAEIGGGFGGKTLIYLEPVALVLSHKTGRAVKIVMTREEVFRATGPTSGGVIEVKLGAKKDGTIVAADLVLKYQAGAFPGSPVQPGCMCAFAMYDLPNVNIVGYDVVSNRPKVAAYRAPGAPISSFGVESCLDELARELDIDPLVLRERNAAKEGTKAVHGPTWTNIGYLDTLAAAKNHPNYQIPLRPNQGRGIACGFWFNVGGESSAQVHVNEDGSVSVASGSPDIGGSRASMAMMAAETLGIPVERVKPIVADTASIGFTGVTGGSRCYLCDRHGDGPSDGEGHRSAEAPRRDDLGHQPRGYRLAGRLRLAGWRQCRQLRPAAVGRYRDQSGTHRRTDRRRGVGQRAGCGPGFRDPFLRCRSRSGDRTCKSAPVHGHAGCRPCDPSELCRRPDPGRRGTRDRLGAQRGVHLRQAGTFG
jgi:CO/xanthine dehydrogenase Mo-binding subunit